MLVEKVGRDSTITQMHPEEVRLFGRGESGNRDHGRKEAIGP
jgi:hypothetical protein